MLPKRTAQQFGVRIICSKECFCIKNWHQKLLLITQFFDCAIGTASFKMFMVNQNSFFVHKTNWEIFCNSLVQNVQKIRWEILSERRKSLMNHDDGYDGQWANFFNHLQGRRYVNLNRRNNFMWIRSVASANNGTVWHEDHQTMINCEKFCWIEIQNPSWN